MDRIANIWDQSGLYAMVGYSSRICDVDNIDSTIVNVFRFEAKIYDGTRMSISPDLYPKKEYIR